MSWGLFFSNPATTLPPNKRNKSCSIICKNSMNSIIRIKIKFNALVIVIIISHHYYSSSLVIVIVINHCQQSLSLVIVITHCQQLLSIQSPIPNAQTCLLYANPMLYIGSGLIMHIRQGPIHSIGPNLFGTSCKWSNP